MSISTFGSGATLPQQAIFSDPDECGGTCREEAAQLRKLLHPFHANACSIDAENWLTTEVKTRTSIRTYIFLQFRLPRRTRQLIA